MATVMLDNLSGTPSTQMGFDWGGMLKGLVEGGTKFAVETLNYNHASELAQQQSQSRLQESIVGQQLKNQDTLLKAQLGQLQKIPWSVLAIAAAAIVGLFVLVKVLKK